MVISSNIRLIGLLFVAGISWGATVPLAKMVVSEGYRHVGVLFWEMVIGAAVLFVVQLMRRRTLNINRSTILVFSIIALLGTILPGLATYEAARFLPAGIMAIVISLVPLMALPIALGLRIEKFAWKRFGGLLVGLSGVLLIVVPESSLPDRAMLIFIPLAIVAPFFYACESNYVARWGTAGLDAIEVLLGASLVGIALCLPLTLVSGEFINPITNWNIPEYALVIMSILHVGAYTLYVWIVGKGGAVFGTQVSYLVTGFGILWSMLLLGESYSVWIWAALFLVMGGVFLVQPRTKQSLETSAEPRDTP